MTDYNYLWKNKDVEVQTELTVHVAILILCGCIKVVDAHTNIICIFIRLTKLGGKEKSQYRVIIFMRGEHRKLCTPGWLFSLRV